MSATRLLAVSIGTLVVAAACQSGAAPGTSTPAQVPAGTPTVTIRSDPGRLEVAPGGWRTDFAKATIDLSELRSGGPPKDGIPAVDAPVAESLGAARSWLADVSPVLAVEVEGKARAYPLAILVWHEIVNDTLGHRPIVVTFCPLCNTGLVFDRTLEGLVHDFGTTGNLRFSDLVMYDRQTESWWQQATGQAIVGELAGRQLTFLPSQIISIKDFATASPDGDVLSRDTGHSRPYGVNPYVGYDDVKTPPFLFDGVVDGRLAAKERVATVTRGTESVAFPYTELAKAGAANVVVGGDPIVVLWAPGTASPLDSRDINGRDIGATRVFSSVLDGKTLTFERAGGPGSPIRDVGTRSSWSISGRATAGPLAGRQLDPIIHGDHFWFAWAAFEPDTRIWMAP